MSQTIKLARQWGVSEKAADLHADALVCDLVIPWGPDFENQEGTLPRFADSGFNFVSLTVGYDHVGLAATIHHMADLRARIRKGSDKYILAESADDLLKAKATGKMALGFNFQGSEGLEGDQNLVDLLYRLGLRQMMLAFNQQTRAADGCHERTDSGLTRYGLKLIAEMNCVGMIVDLTHVGYRSSLEAIEASQAPVIFSHSNVYNLTKHPRNVHDDQIKACAQKGGMVGVTGFGPILGEVSCENLIRHIEYIAHLVGPQHVGFGLDFVYYPNQLYRRFLAAPDRWPESYPTKPEDWKSFPPEQFPQVTEGLLKNNYSEKDIRGILGENFLRVARQVWK